MTAVLITLLTALYILAWAYPASCEVRLEKRTLALKREMELLKKGIEAHRIIYGEYPAPPLGESLSRMKGYETPEAASSCTYKATARSYTLRAEVKIRKKNTLFTSDTVPSITILNR